MTDDPAKPAVPVSQTLTLMLALPSVISRPAEPFAGAVFAHLPGDVKRPALIVLGGSEGGALVTRDAPIYASRGYAVLALPYYSPAGWSPTGPTPAALPSLPPAFVDIPVERLQQARDWLAQQPQVDASRIGVLGTSKGAELALLAAAKMPWCPATWCGKAGALAWPAASAPVLLGRARRTRLCPTKTSTKNSKGLPPALT